MKLICTGREPGSEADATSMPSPATTHAHGLFTTTHWTVVLQAGQAGSPDAGAALAGLCRAYWYPLYAFARRLGRSPEDAQDLVQGFFEKVVEKNYLGAADPAKGRFRSFLLLAFKRFVANEWHRSQRQKRGGNHEFLSLESESGDTELRYRSDPADELSPEKLYDRHWARTLLEQVLNQLDKEYVQAGNGRVFQELKIFLTGEKGERPYADIARDLGVAEGTLRGTVFRLRQRYRELLKREIAKTVDTPEAVEDEIRQLFAALS